MALTCPACRKLNDVESNAECDRCGCDLGALAAIDESAHWHLSAAVERLRAGDRPGARAHAEHSLALRSIPAASLLLRYTENEEER